MFVDKRLTGLILCLMPFFACAQKCVIANTKMNAVYLGVPNPIDVAVEGYLCRNLIVTTDNGRLEPLDDSCSYDLSVEKAGKATITITEKKTG